ncbi:MAG: hybrid sensor histidine kinase/response regulator [Deltaproteobacteria bacterium]|nr:hybrid sensor histidine kinase/response regulator [Deltaproteobacteria bacterium]
MDDEPVCRELVRAYLEPNHRVIEAAGADDARSALATEPVDVVLLDIGLEGANGIDVCREIKSKAAGFLPVLLVTGRGDRESRTAGLEAGADDFLCKPVDRRELELRVAMFLRIREQERLVRRQVEELQRLDALKDDLVSFIVHDLRNPLASILAFLAILQEELADPVQREDVASALHSAGRLREMLEDMLKVRQLEEGGMAVELRPRSIAAAIRDAMASVAGAARERRQELRLEVERDVELPLDHKLVVRAIENLLLGAIRCSPPGEAVAIRLGPADGGAAVEVSDRGEAIPDGLIPGIFDKFGSLDARRRVVRRGQGMGLYLVRLVAAAHRGCVSAHDRAGGGTTLRLVLGG